jgi:MFS family permease
MKIQKLFQQKAILTRHEVACGLRALTWEGIASAGFSTLTASTFMVAFALALGANNFQIGILACLPFITDLIQIPAVWLIEKRRSRKAIVVITWLVSSLLWIPIALIPLFMDIPGKWPIFVLLGIVATRGVLNAFTNCGWNSWKRDLVPQNILGRYFARRLSLATALSVVLGLGAGYFLDTWNGGEGGVFGYTIVIIIGLVVFGLASPILMLLVPEPVMAPAIKRKTAFFGMITKPLQDKNYRRYMKYLALWGFASNLAVPFFAVFLLQQLKLSLFTVIILTTISEIFVVISLRVWGTLADKFGSKTVLYISSSLFLMVLVGWAATIFVANSDLLLPMLGVLHVFNGVAVSGITLTAGTLNYKLAPTGQATFYLTATSLADSAGIGLGALAGGFLADLFTRQLNSINLSWFSSGNLKITGYHVLFIVALIIGVMTLRVLHSVYETGAARKRALVSLVIVKTGAQFQWIVVAFAKKLVIPLLLGLRGLIIYVVEKTLTMATHLDREALKLIPLTIRELERKPPSEECTVLMTCYSTKY